MTQLAETLAKNSTPSLLAEKWSAQVTSVFTPSAPTGKRAMTLPPPNVTGSLHMGHALTYSLQDVWIKFWRMQGEEVLAQPGLDHAGIATQMMVERHLAKQGRTREQLGREKFLKEAFAFKEHAGGTIITQLKHLGVSANWDRLMFTLDALPQKAVRHVFVRLFNEGLIYQSERLVHWDTQLKTALSNLEVQNKEVKGHLWTIRYQVANVKEEYIDIATTRPETLFGDLAVAVHPDDNRYKAYIGKHAHVPFTNRTIPIVADMHAEQDKGTGALKITPSHDFVDFEVGKTHNLGHLIILDEEGRLNDNVPEDFRGLSAQKAREKVIQALQENEQLINEEAISHAVPCGDRSGTVLEPKLTKQWFLNVAPMAKKALEALNRGKPDFLPDHYKNTYTHWLSTIEPWCISRQLWWGHTIPAWYGPDDTPFVADTEEEAQKAAEKYYGKSVTLTPDPDVLDTWFSSALWPFVTLGWPHQTADMGNFYPTQTLITGFDIIFFWVARMTMMGVHLTGKIPFNEVYIHGLVRAQDRQKMSKTKGNVINPLEIIDQYGADALRLSLVALSTPGRDMAFSTQNVEVYRNFLTKLWNATRFCLMQGMAYPEALPKPAHDLNAWLLEKAEDTRTRYLEAMRSGRFYEAAHLIYHFVWGTFCDDFIELSKALLVDATQSLAKEVQQIGGWVLGQCLHMLFPFAPFITSELWSHLAPHHKTLTHSIWKEQSAPASPEASQTMDTVLLWTAEIRRLRALLQIPFKKRLDAFVAEAPPPLKKHQDFAEHFMGIKLNFQNAPQDMQGIQSVLGGQLFFISLDQVIDADKTRTLLEKKVQTLQKEKVGLEQRLNNPRFKEKAPADLVQEAEEKLHVLCQDEEALCALVTQLR